MITDNRRYRITKKTFIFLIFFALLLIVIGILILNSAEHQNNNVTIIFTFVLNIAICFSELIKEVRKHSFSLTMMFWLFGVFFFGFAPLLQYLANFYAWNLDPKESELLRNNIYILIWYMMFVLGRNIKIKIRKNNYVNKNIKYMINQQSLSVLLIICILITLYNIRFIGLSNLFIRASNTNEDFGKTISLLTNHGFHNIVLFTTVLFILDAKQKRRVDFRTVVSLICFLLSCFPTGMARNMMASFYGGMMIIMFSKNRNRRIITIAIIAGLVLVFPAINLFRNYWTLSNNNAVTYIQNSIRGTYLSGDFDAFQMFISIRRWQQLDGFAYGKQLLGALLFFVPRSIWPSKPYGTGQTAFERTGQYWFTNVSAPLISEGYINFGIIGIILFALILGIISKSVDKLYWSDHNSLSFTGILYPFVVFQYFFLMRGDMLSCSAYMLAQIVIGFMVWKFTVHKKIIPGGTV